MNRRIFAGPAVVVPLPVRARALPERMRARLPGGAPVGRPTFRIEAKESAKSADIYFYEVIGYDFWTGGGTTAKDFADEMKKLSDVSHLNIFINSPGGDVFDGVTIYNVLRRHRAHKVVQIDGLAASIASVIAMAGDEIKIALNGLMMIHKAWAGTVGNADDMTKMAATLAKVDDSICGTYVDRSGGDPDEFARLMAEETWFTADEAVEIGLADSVIEAVEMAALAKFDLSGFKHVPERLGPAALPAPSAVAPTPITPEAAAALRSRIASANSRLRKRTGSAA